MKKYLIIIGILALLLGALKYSTDKARQYKQMYYTATQNVLAYEAENSKQEGEIRQFQFTMNELQRSKDSINRQLVQTLKKMKIKESSVQNIQYSKSVITKTDTIILRDTIFKESVQNVDTTIMDQWYSLNLKLNYPSSIQVSPTFSSKKYVVVHTKKEYVNKPSKIFFIRWFQKKRTVATIDVFEENPYITNEEERFIQIVK